MINEFWRVLRFLTAGLLNAVFGYGCYAAFILAGAPLWLAVVCSTVLGILFNFLSYGGLVFGTTSQRLLPRFLLFYGGLGALNFMLLRLLTWLGPGPLLAQAMLLPFLAATAYFGMRAFVFCDVQQGAD